MPPSSPMSIRREHQKHHPLRASPQRRHGAAAGGAASSSSSPRRQGVMPHAYTMALRSQWSLLVQLIREQHNSFQLQQSAAENGGSGGLPSTTVMAAMLACDAGIDVEISRVLSNIRSDAMRAACEEGEELFPLLLALAIAPIPTSHTQTLAAEVLAKLMVAVSSSSSTIAIQRMLDSFITGNKVLSALEAAVQTSPTPEVTTALLELVFVVTTSSPVAAASLLTQISFLKYLVAMLRKGTPASHVCYIAATLQSIARHLPDAPAIFCSYDVHHQLLNFIYEANEEDTPVTAVSMVLRVAITTARGFPVPFRPLLRQPPLHRIVCRLITSSWSDLADLGGVLLATLLSKEFLMQTRESPRPTVRRDEQQLEFEEDIGIAFATTLLANPSSSCSSFSTSESRGDWGNTSATAPLSGAMKTKKGGSSSAAAAASDSTNLVTTLSSLMCSADNHIATSAAMALLSLSKFCPTHASTLLFSNPTALHNVITLLVEAEPDVGAATAASSSSHSNSRNSTVVAAVTTMKMPRALCAFTVCLLLAVGTPQSRNECARHLRKHLSSATRDVVWRSIQTLLSSETLHLSFFSTLSHPQQLRDVLLRKTRSSLNANAGSGGGTDDDEQSMWLLRRNLFLHVARDVLHTGCGGGGDERNAAAVVSAASSQTALTAALSGTLDAHREDPRMSIHTSTFIQSSIRVVVQLAKHYKHGAALQPSPQQGSEHNTRGGGGGAAGSNNTGRSSSSTMMMVMDHRSASNSTTAMSSSALQGTRQRRSSSMDLDRSSAVFPLPHDINSKLPINAWAAPVKHDVDRKWSVEHLQREDIFLFDCPIESLTPGLHEVVDALHRHTAQLLHQLRLSSMSQPLRRCVLQDLLHNVYPVLLSCVEFIAQEIGATRTASRVIVEGAHSVNSANVLEIYHAIGLAASARE